MKQWKKRGRHIAVLLLCLMTAAFGLSSCSKAPDTPQYPLSETTAYVRPDTREPITDPELISKLENRKDIRVFYPETPVTQLQSPVVLIIYDKQEKEYDYGVTDLFETTKDLSEAKSIVLIEDSWTSSSVSKDSVIREYRTWSNCHVISPDFSVMSLACKLNSDSCLYGNVAYTPHFTAENDRESFQKLSNTVTIAPSADNTYMDVMLCLGLYDYQKDIELLKKACTAYDYPESENLATHPDLVDWDLPFILYSALSLSSLRKPDIAGYSTPDDLYSGIRSYDVVNESVEAWGKYCHHESSCLIGIIEYVGGNFAGNYYPQNSATRIAVYAPVYRCTIVDVNAGRAIAWYMNSSVTLDKEELYFSKMKEANGYHYYMFYNPISDFIQTNIDENHIPETKNL